MYKISIVSKTALHVSPVHNGVEVDYDAKKSN